MSSVLFLSLMCPMTYPGNRLSLSLNTQIFSKAGCQPQGSSCLCLFSAGFYTLVTTLSPLACNMRYKLSPSHSCENLGFPTSAFSFEGGAYVNSELSAAACWPMSQPVPACPTWASKNTPVLFTVQVLVLQQINVD